MDSIYSANKSETVAHRLQVAEEAQFLAISDRRVTSEVIDSALALYDFALAEGWTYGEETRWAEINPDDVASVFIRRALS